MLKDQQIAVYITGGIAVYKAAAVVRGLIKQGAKVRVAMTQSATEFVTPQTFAVLTKQRVLVDLFDQATNQLVPHIELADWSDLAVVVPATANVLAKLANGIADDAVTAALLATTAPKLVVPAMNEHMWQAPATQRNLAQLRQDGVIIMEPAVGMLAEGYAGRGRLPDPAAIVDFIRYQVALKTGQLQGRTVLVTAGGTKERLDPVRYISNDSSGKMGYALASAAADQGAKVILVSTVHDRAIPAGVTLVPVESAQEMLTAIQQQFSTLDVIVMAAAVADFRPATVAEQKIKKTTDNDQMTLSLIKNPDILKTLAGQRKQQVMVGFAAETQQLIENATHKLTEKQLAMLVANDVSKKDRGFNADTNEVTILRPHQAPESLPMMSKTALAEALIERILPLLPVKK